MFDRGKLIIIIFESNIFLCLPPYNSNFRYFVIERLVCKTSNLQDSTVYSKLNLLVSAGTQDLITPINQVIQ